MKTWARFLWGEGEQGEVGFVLKDQPNFDPVSWGAGFAHDALEHFPDGGYGDNGMANEMLALGALIYGRGQARVFDLDPGVILSDELDYRVTEAYHQLATPPYRIPALKDETVEGWIRQATDSARRYVLGEWEHWGCERSEEHLDSMLQDMACWLRMGFHKAKRRYLGANPYSLAGVFDKVKADGARLLARHAGDGELGDELQVLLDPQTLDSQVRVLLAGDVIYA